MTLNVMLSPSNSRETNVHIRWLSQDLLRRLLTKYGLKSVAFFLYGGTWS